MPKITEHGGASNRFDDDEIVTVIYKGRKLVARRGDLKDPKNVNDEEFFKGLREAPATSDATLYDMPTPAKSGETRPEKDEDETEQGGEGTDTEGEDSELEDGAEGSDEGDDEDEEGGDESSLGSSSSTSTKKMLRKHGDSLTKSPQRAPTTGTHSKKGRRA